MTLATAIVAITPSAASAKGPVYKSVYNSELVQHDDLDLASHKHVAKLHRRVDRAAKHVCSLPGIAADILKREINNCVDEARADALANFEQRISILTVNAGTAN